MCGIAGLATPRMTVEELRVSVELMNSLQRHRGPDGKGVFVEPGIALGHRRLSILDLSDAGRQPMIDPTGRYVLTFNGEIYNYLELRDELKAKGHVFQSRSDTEVLLHAVMEWGADCLSRLRGMFAFAVWDKRKKRLFAARDRFGIKPFHYLIDPDGGLVFASEIKALLPFLDNREVDETILGWFLAWGMSEFHQERTFLRDVKKLAPAHYLLWEPGKPLECHRYWSFSVEPRFENSHAELFQDSQRFRSAFLDAVDVHLRSDVPVGTCLSGGLDSSSIVGATSYLLRKRGQWKEDWQHSFSACFDEPEIDERPWIEAVIDKTKATRHYTFPSSEEYVEDLPSLVWHQEEPFAGTSPYAQYRVAKLAKEQGIKVLLDGQGSDEYLAGYEAFIWLYLKELTQRGQWREFIQDLPAFETVRPAGVWEKGRKLITKFWRNKTGDLERLYGASAVPRVPSEVRVTGTVNELVEMRLSRSVMALLRYEDRNTMAFSIESRVPFLDHPLVEATLSMPVKSKISGGWTKRVLREGLADLLPDKVRLRKSKLGFATPEDVWMRGALGEWVRQTLEHPTVVTKYVDPSGLQDLLRETPKLGYNAPRDSLLFRLAMVEAWNEHFLNRDLSAWV